MSRDSEALSDILQAAQQIARYMQNVDRARLETDDQDLRS
jgi:uncharacterized protein with HEPN domain